MLSITTINGPTAGGCYWENNEKICVGDPTYNPVKDPAVHPEGQGATPSGAATEPSLWEKLLYGFGVGTQRFLLPGGGGYYPAGVFPPGINPATGLPWGQTPSFFSNPTNLLLVGGVAVAAVFLLKKKKEA